MLARVELSSSKVLVWQGSQKAALNGKHQLGHEVSNLSQPGEVGDPHRTNS